MIGPGFAADPKTERPARAAPALTHGGAPWSESKSRLAEATGGGSDGPRPGAAGDGGGTDVIPAPLARAPLPAPTSDIAIEDLSILLGAVKERLALTVGERDVAAPDAQVLSTLARVRASVLECVAALDQLHPTIARELDRRKGFELEIFDARTALAQARADLFGTQAQERRARHLALHDSLTSLPNRSFFQQRLDHALAQDGPSRLPLAVLYLDLDRFKPVNDTYGHDTGDELLRIVAARLTRTVRSGDMVSRLGGDEFAFLLADVPSRERLGELACKLVEAVSAPLKIGSLQLSVRPSIGIAVCPDDGARADALLRNADAAMYRAKRQQTGFAFFDRRADACAHASGLEN